MAAKLKSISAQIHWSLLLKAGLFALAWWFLPPIWFVFAAILLYFIPWFEPRRLAPAFAALLGMALYLPHSGPVFAGLLLGFGLIIGVKDLFFVERFAAYVWLMLLLMLLFASATFALFAGPTLAASAWLLCWGLLFFLAFGGFRFYLPHADGRKVAIVSALAGFLSAELGLAVLMAPLTAAYAALMLFVSQAALGWFLLRHVQGGYSRRNLLLAGSAFFIFAVLILASAEFGI